MKVLVIIKPPKELTHFAVFEMEPPEGERVPIYDRKGVQFKNDDLAINQEYLKKFMPNGNLLPEFRTIIPNEFNAVEYGQFQLIVP